MGKVRLSYNKHPTTEEVLGGTKELNESFKHISHILNNDSETMVEFRIEKDPYKIQKAFEQSKESKGS